MPNKYFYNIRLLSCCSPRRAVAIQTFSLSSYSVKHNHSVRKKISHTHADIIHVLTCRQFFFRLELNRFFGSGLRKINIWSVIYFHPPALWLLLLSLFHPFPIRLGRPRWFHMTIRSRPNITVHILISCMNGMCKERAERLMCTHSTNYTFK